MLPTLLLEDGANMAVQTTYEDSDRSLIVSIQGALDFHLRKDLQRACEQHETPRRLIVNLGEVTNPKTSGIGLLLLLREFAEAWGCREITLHCRSREMLNLIKRLNFHRLFQIEDSVSCT